MNLRVFAGEDDKNNYVYLDFAKQNLNLMLLIGGSGTGKSYFHTKIYDQLIGQNSADEIGFFLIDNTVVDFFNFPESFLFKPKVNKPREGIEVLSEAIKGNYSTRRAIIHIEESDLFIQYPEEMKRIFIYFIKNKISENMHVVYSTSRPSVAEMPDWLVKAADLKVIFRLAGEDNCERMKVTKEPLNFKTGEKMLNFKNGHSIICRSFGEYQIDHL